MVSEGRKEKDIFNGLRGLAAKGGGGGNATPVIGPAVTLFHFVFNRPAWQGRD